ncbi:MAG: xanthine dehydrogenase family protein molybdopterin-binding subunit [Deltaproteobacteria bacterium]|nr:MAG: xanthine dehydrogenase family protein molybdopterin-binding subunit [Deltaproteobacteria bacterium]
MAETQKIFGASIKRKEDPRFLTGRGNFTDDVKLPGTTYAVFVRSPHAHARIRSIDSSAAKALKGVLAVFTGKDLADAKVGSLPCGWLLPGIKVPPHLPLAADKARYMGDAVAVVIAESPYIAKDAAELVDVDYQVLQAIADTEKSLLPAAAQVHDQAPGNVCFNWSIGDKAKTEAAFKSAAKVVKQRIVNQRLIPNAMEPRASLASANPATGDVTLWVTSQNPHVHRLLIGAFVLGIGEHKLRVISPDVGGGFGSKIFVYPEECVVTFASRKLSRPVKWTAERRESFMADAHGRDHVSDAEIAFDENGKIVGLRVKTIANLGAYLSTFAPLIPSYLYGTMLSGVYDIPSIYCEVTGVFTNTAPVDAYRGAGRPEAAFLVERMVDLGARALDTDPVELRRKNFIPKEKFPYQTAVAFVYDSGDHHGALEKALEIADYRKLREEQAQARKNGRYLGIGVATYVEVCGPAPSQAAGSLGAQAGLYESANVRVHPTGAVTVFTGSHSHGQGHETTFAQVAAQELGIPIENIEVVHGDTAQIPFGMGTYGSRSAPVGATAVYLSLQKIKEKARKIAAHLLEANENDVVFEDGKLSVKGSPDRFKTFGDVALMAYLAHNLPKGLEPGLEFNTFFDPPNFTFPFGTHIAVVEVERDTGQIKLERYVAVDDVGNVINPMIVDGMVHGGIVQGVSQALWEAAVYDENGQLVTGSMMNYTIPRADDVISFETARTVTPTPVNPLGVKGAGETGTIASTAAIANAVMDALAPLGVKHIDMPLTPGRIWDAIKGR